MFRRTKPADQLTAAQCPLRLIAMLVLVAAGLVSAVLGSQSLGPVEAQPAATPVDPWPRPVNIIAGDCTAPGNVAWPLNALTSPDGTQAGSVDAYRTEYSFTSNVPLTITDLLAGGYAIQVQESAQAPQTVLACGNIGGVQDSIGQLVVGLRWQAGLDVTGIAVLSPSPSDATRTLVSVFISGASLGHETGTWTEQTDTATQAPGADTPVANTPIVDEPTEIVVYPTEDDHGGDDDDGGGDDNGGHGGDDGGGDDNSGSGGGGSDDSGGDDKGGSDNSGSGGGGGSDDSGGHGSDDGGSD